MRAGPGYYVDRGYFPPATTLHRLDDPSRDVIGVMLRTGTLVTTRWIAPALVASTASGFDSLMDRQRFLLEQEHWFRLAHARGGYS